MKNIVQALFAGLLLLSFELFAEETGATETDDFAKDVSGWDFSLGKEFPGAQGNLYHEGKDGVGGNGCACLEGDFSGGGNYVGMRKTFNPMLPVKEIAFNVKTSDLSFVYVILRDSTGQDHQLKCPLQDKQDWQKLVIGESTWLDGKHPHWGGAKDGKWHGAAMCVLIVLDKAALVNREGKRGSMLLDEVEFKSVQK